MSAFIKGRRQARLARAIERQRNRTDEQEDDDDDYTDIDDFDSDGEGPRITQSRKKNPSLLKRNGDGHVVAGGGGAVRQRSEADVENEDEDDDDDETLSGIGGGAGGGTRKATGASKSKTAAAQRDGRAGNNSRARFVEIEGSPSESESDDGGPLLPETIARGRDDQRAENDGGDASHPDRWLPKRPEKSKVAQQDGDVGSNKAAQSTKNSKDGGDGGKKSSSSKPTGRPARPPRREREQGDEGEEDEDDSESAAAGTIRCDVQIVPSNPVGSTLDDWNVTRLVHVDRSRTLAAFDEDVRLSIVTLLDRDDKLLETCRMERCMLPYELHYLVSACGERRYLPNASRHSFEVIGDFFEDPSAAGLVLGVEVHVDYRKQRPDVEAQPGYGFNRITEEVETGEKDEEGEEIVEVGRRTVPAKVLVVPETDLDPNKDRWAKRYIRIGNLAEPSQSDSSSSEESENDAAAALASQRPGLPTPTTLIGMYYTEPEVWLFKTKDLFLQGVQAVELGDQCVGNVEIGREIRNKDLSEDDEYFKPYANLQGKAALFQKVKGVQPGVPSPGSGVPFMPHHTLNNFDSKTRDLGVKLKGGGKIKAVVRFFDHIRVRNLKDDRPTETLTPHWLPCFHQLLIKRHDNADEIVRELKAGLEKLCQRMEKRNAAATKNMRATLTKLLARKDWRFKLWVLPQGLKKLYQFPNRHEGSWGTLEEFWSREKFGNGGEFATALYMEAHIVFKERPVDEDGQMGEANEGQEAARSSRSKGKGRVRRIQRKGTGKDAGDGDERRTSRKRAR